MGVGKGGGEGALCVCTVCLNRRSREMFKREVRRRQNARVAYKAAGAGGAALGAENRLAPVVPPGSG